MRLIDADALREVIISFQYTPSCNENERCVRAIDAAPTVGGWISVEDALPTEIGQYCWVCGTGWEEPDLDWWEGSGGFYRNSIAEVTHWIPCPMPEPPKEVQE